MTRPAVPALSETASHLVHRISELMRRLHDLQDEEARLDAQTFLLQERLQKAKDKAPASPILVVRRGTPVAERAGDNGQSTPPHIDPKNIETPVKTFLLMESFSLAMSVKSKRKGRIFLTGDSTEFGERRQAVAALGNFP